MGRASVTASTVGLAACLLIGLVGCDPAPRRATFKLTGSVVASVSNSPSVRCGKGSPPEHATWSGQVDGKRAELSISRMEGGAVSLHVGAAWYWSVGQGAAWRNGAYVFTGSLDPTDAGWGNPDLSRRVRIEATLRC